jgi:hypothetical protein
MTSPPTSEARTRPATAAGNCRTMKLTAPVAAAASRESPAQVFVEGLNVNPEARAQGYDDAINRRPWRGMASADAFSYALGYGAGERERDCCSGERAQGEAA